MTTRFLRKCQLKSVLIQIKRKAKELEIEFGRENWESEPQTEPIRDSREPQTPAEIMMAGRMGRQ